MNDDDRDDDGRRCDPGEWNGDEYVIEYWTRIRNAGKAFPCSRNSGKTFESRRRHAASDPIGHRVHCGPAPPPCPHANFSILEPSLRKLFWTRVMLCATGKRIDLPSGKLFNLPYDKNLAYWPAEIEITDEILFSSKTTPIPPGPDNIWKSRDTIIIPHKWFCIEPLPIGDFGEEPKGSLSLWSSVARDHVLQAATEVYRLRALPTYMQTSVALAARNPGQGQYAYDCFSWEWDPPEPRIARAVTAYQEKRNRRKPRAKPQTKVYPLTIDPSKFIEDYRNLVMSIIKKSLWAWNLLGDVSDEDIEQLRQDINLVFCKDAQAGKIRAAYGIKSYVTWLKKTAHREALKFCGKTAVEQAHRGELPEWSSIEDLPGEEVAEFDGEGEEFIENWIDTIEDGQAELRPWGIRKGTVLGDSHRYGQNPASECERQDWYDKVMGPTLWKSGAIYWLNVWFRALARGDDRVDAHDYAAYQSLFQITPRQIKRAIQLAKAECKTPEFIKEARRFGYDKGLVIAPIPPAYRLSVTGFRFLVGYRAPEKMVSVDTIPSEWGHAFMPTVGTSRYATRIQEIILAPSYTRATSPGVKFRIRPPRPLNECPNTPPKTPLKPYRNEKFDCPMPPIDQPIFPHDHHPDWLNYKQIPPSKAEDELFWPF